MKKRLWVLSLIAMTATGCWLSQDVTMDDGDDTLADMDSNADSNGDSGSEPDRDSETEQQDSVTGVCDSPWGVFDQSTGVCWQRGKSSIEDNHLNATQYCEGSTAGGHSDWVLPSQQNYIDLLGGCDDSVLSGAWGFCNPCAESVTCTELFGEDVGHYWTSSYSAENGESGLVYFSNGAMGYSFFPSLHFARCVRSGT